MNQFTQKYADHIQGTLSGFDRLVFRGTLRPLSFVAGMMSDLSAVSVLLKEFRQHALEVTQRLRTASMAECQRLRLPMPYLNSGQISKEDRARAIAIQQGITQGPICILRTVELRPSFEVYRNQHTKRWEWVSRCRPCLHLYHYSIHPVFGFMNARIQTWFPFHIQICIHG